MKKSKSFFENIVLNLFCKYFQNLENSVTSHINGITAVFQVFGDFCFRLPGNPGLRNMNLLTVTSADEFELKLISASDFCCLCEKSTHGKSKMSPRINNAFKTASDKGDITVDKNILIHKVGAISTYNEYNTFNYFIRIIYLLSGYFFECKT